jgi:hypothetical protein
MGTSQTNEMTVRLSREVVARIASEELALFDPTATAFLRDPQQVRRAVKEGKPPLSFGAGELVTIVTPFVLTISYEVVRFLSEPVKAGLAEYIKDFFKDMVSRAKPPSSDMKLTPEKLRAARERGMDVARELKLNDGRAALVVDTIIAYLATAMPNQ